MGSKGQMVVESSFSVSGFQPKGASKMLPDDGFGGMFPEARGNPSPHRSTSRQDLSHRALQDTMAPPRYEDDRRSAYGGSAYDRPPALEAGRYQPSYDRQAPSQRALAPSPQYERSRRISNDAYSSSPYSPRMLESSQMRSPRAIAQW
jgi:hypothetical protein